MRTITSTCSARRAIRDLTPGTKLKAMFSGWSRDDSSFNVLTNERDPRFFDVYRYDAEKLDRTLDLQGHGGLSGRRRLRRRPMGGARQADDDGRRRHLCLGHAGPPDDPPDAPQDPHSVQRLGVRPRLEMALLPDQRRRRVHPRAGVTSWRPESTKTSSRPTGTFSSRGSRATAATASRPSTKTAGPSSASTTRRRDAWSRCPSYRKAT